VRALHEDRVVLDATLGMDDHVIQVYGANTEVGKTVITAGLCQAAERQGLQVSYIKPVQTGDASDATFVSDHVPSCKTKTLFNYTDPVSPHLAADRDGVLTADVDVLSSVVSEIKQVLSEKCEERRSGSGMLSPTARVTKAGTLTLVETAGGVLSPAPSGSLQADVYRPMRLPVLLVGDGRLGGIGATLSSLESLRTRGYTVLGIALLAQEEDLGNAEAVGRHSGGVPVFELGALPPPQEPLGGWYTSQGENFSLALNSLMTLRTAVAHDLSGFKERALKTIWWPFTQHSGIQEGDVMVVDSAYGDYFNTVGTCSAASKGE
ncbi:unnamed protein product, partial [Choristocarpus tenellus]